jgi:hypothetical protein
MIVLHTPIKKTTNYVSKITTNNGKTVRINIHNCKFVYLKEQPSGGHLLRIIIPKDIEEYKQIIDIDESICKNAVKNNQKWFNNNLTEEEICQFFRASLNVVQDTMTVMISDLKDTIITLNEVVVDSLDGIDFKSPVIRLSLVIEAQGLYFFPKKFGIRWSVNKIALYNSELDLDSNNINDTCEIFDKDTIENDWDHEVMIIKDLISQDIDKFKNKIIELQKFSNNLEKTLEDGKKTLAINEWNLKLTELSHLITKYYGRITREDVQ